MQVDRVGKQIKLQKGDGLIIVHLQNDFMAGGSLAVPKSNEIIPVINKYLKIFQASRLPIIFTRDWHPSNHCSFKEQGGLWPMHCVVGTKGAEFPPQLHVPDGIQIISGATQPEKEAYSGFEESDLDQILKNMQVQRLFIAGVATDYCVFNTVKDAVRLEYEVVLLEDAARAVNVQPGDGDAATKKMISLGTKLHSIKDIITPTPCPDPLSTDLYQLTMMQTYIENKMDELAVFELYVRRLPVNRSFIVCAGLEQVLEYLESIRFSNYDIERLKSIEYLKKEFVESLKDFSFTGNVDAVPEGTILFSNEPFLRVTAPLPQAQFVETCIINILQFQTMVATKAARMVLSAPDKMLVDFGLRRTHSTEAGSFAARASFIAGFTGTATVKAALDFGIPVFGTMAHSFIQAHESENDAFKKFAHSHPENIILLLDTYEIKRATEKVVKLARELQKENITIKGVRLDSGNLCENAKAVRNILDSGGFPFIRIIVSGDLDEYALEKLISDGAPVDGFGIGTKLTTSADSPFLECVYKIQEYAGRPTKKFSIGKNTHPGVKQVYRIYDEEGYIKEDKVCLDGEESAGFPLLNPLVRNGIRVASYPSILKIRNYTASQLNRLPEHLKSLTGDFQEPVRFSKELEEFEREGMHKSVIF